MDEENILEESAEMPRNRKMKNDSGEKKIIFTRWQVVKNLFVICMGLILLFIAYNGLSMLQSTMNQEQGIGVASQAIIYGAFCFSALLFPKYVIKKLGCKRTLLFSMCCYVPYVAANFYFNWYTMVPSALMVGLSASLLWSSECTYFNEASSIYTILVLKERHEKGKHLVTDVSNRNSNINSKRVDLSTFPYKQKENLNLQTLDASKLQNPNSAKLCNCSKYLNNEPLNNLEAENKDKNIYDLTECSLCTVGSKQLINSCIEQEESQRSPIIDSEEYAKLIASVTARFFGIFGLLYRTSDIWSNLMSYYILNDNSSFDNITEFSNCSCGAGFCNVESHCFEHNLAEPNQQLRNLLSGVSVVIALLGILLVFLFLDELETDKEPVKFSLSLAMATCKFARQKEALLLIPLSSYIGFQQAFYIADFTKAYIACSWGVYHVGLVTVCYGIAAGISSTVSGLLVKYIGRILVMLLGAFINAATILYLLLWNPLPDQPMELFISAGMWGISVGILWSQLRAFYGVIFKKDEEAAFAGFYLWDSIGYCIAFSYSNYLCTYIKIYTLLAVSTVGVVGYLKTEMIYRKQSKKGTLD